MKHYTRDPIIWTQYICWQVQWWMTCHRPHVIPHLVTKGVTRLWMFTWRGARPNEIPPWLQWMWVAHLPGWEGIARFFRRHTGGRSHRCEFTDPHQGALYGGKEGAFMDRLFEQFIARISDE